MRQRVEKRSFSADIDVIVIYFVLISLSPILLFLLKLPNRGLNLLMGNFKFVLAVFEGENLDFLSFDFKNLLLISEHEAIDFVLQFENYLVFLFI